MAFQGKVLKQLLCRMHSQRFLLGAGLEGGFITGTPVLQHGEFQCTSAASGERVCLHPLGLQGPAAALVPAAPASGPAGGAEQRSPMAWDRGLSSAAGGRGCLEWPALSQSQALGLWQGGCAMSPEVWPS